MDLIEVRDLKLEEYPLWDKFIETSKNGTIFQSVSWLISAGLESGMDTKIFGAFSHNQLVGGCAVHFYKFAGIFNSATTEVPLSPYGGVIIISSESVKIRERESEELSIINSLITAIQNKRPHNIFLTMSPQIVDIRPYTWQGWNASVGYCYIFNLSVNIIEHVSKKVRWSVNKAKNEGITARQLWDKDIYWNLTLNTYHKQGRDPPFSQKLLFKLMDIIQERGVGEMWIAETSSGDITAAEIIIWDSRMVYRWSAASNNLYKYTGSTSFLIFEIMIHLQKKGYMKFNMMAANTPNLTKFVSSFNPEIVPYYSVQKSWGLIRLLDAIRLVVKR